MLLYSVSFFWVLSTNIALIRIFLSVSINFSSTYMVVKNIGKAAKIIFSTNMYIITIKISHETEF